jgi:hypothetical protein
LIIRNVGEAVHGSVSMVIQRLIGVNCFRIAKDHSRIVQKENPMNEETEKLYAAIASRELENRNIRQGSWRRLRPGEG